MSITVLEFSLLKIYTLIGSNINVKKIKRLDLNINIDRGGKNSKTKVVFFLPWNTISK